MKRSFIGFCSMLALASGQLAFAQQSAAQECEAAANRRKAEWARTTHSALATDWELQTRELSLALCRARASTGEEKRLHFEDFGRVLFTGAGVHPIIGTIAPGNGLAAGVSLAHDANSATSPIRYRTTAEARVSLNRSWELGARLALLGSAPTASNAHINAAVDVDHWHINEVPFFGIGPASAPDATEFGLTRSSARFNVEAPGPGGVSVFGQAGILRAAAFTSPASGVVPVRLTFSDDTAPAIDQPTTYAVLGGGVDWRVPAGEVVTGYQTSVSVGVRRYQELHGYPYSFARADLGWTNSYTPGTDVDLGTITASARAVLSSESSGQRIPFYLQPTLGGTDINGVGGLRSFDDGRFRAPDLAALQLEYTRAVVDPVGLLAFVDFGGVARQASDFHAANIHHSYGVGVVFRLGDRVFGQMYYAWGGGAGPRVNISGNTFDAASPASRGF